MKLKISCMRYKSSVGERVCAHIDATLGALNVNLSSDQIARLDTASVVPLGTPHEQINGSAPAIAGGKPKLLGVPEIPAA